MKVFLLLVFPSFLHMFFIVFTLPFYFFLISNFFSLSLPFAPPLLVSTLFFPFIHFTFPFPPLQTYIPTTSLLVLKMCSHYFVVFFLQLNALIDALHVYFNQSCFFFCCLPISSFHYFVVCLLQVLFVPINLTCDVGPSVNWLPN